MKTHCDLVVEVAARSMATIGGDVAQSVSMRRVPSDAKDCSITKAGVFCSDSRMK
jgi:hypothetical protein